MIKRILLAILAVSYLGACDNNEDIRFEVPTEFREIKFEPIPGGALMRYYLPNEKDIYGVQVRYVNAWGEEIVKNGTYLSDSLVLDGFTEEQMAVPAQLTFINRDMVESEPLNVTFATEKSATVAVFDSLKVNAYWGGFNVIYDAPYLATGMIHIFYIGINPMTHESDSILLTSIPITEGGDTLNFVLQQQMDSVDVVIRTDSYSGKFVKQRVVEGLPCLTMDTLPATDFNFQFTGNIIENEEFEFGQKYLLDGKKNGINYYTNRKNGDVYKYATFMAGPNAVWHNDSPEENRFIVDLGKPQVPAAVNLYAYLYYKTDYPFRSTDPPFLAEVWDGNYPSRLPSKISLYGTNENPQTVSLNSCVKLYSLNAGEKINESWAALTDFSYTNNIDIWGWTDSWITRSKEEIEMADPVVLNMLCNYTGEKFRYLIFVIEATFEGGRTMGANIREYITIDELEVCVKAEYN